ncbi:hypothetical protein E1B28_007811 [Marasmius oreades]|uniref:Uncharacterized protein n=1 Tax=Marasmius oreades TaxID=181124 RepID=A0A9P7UVZ3_9AGAR|nr:uncharacterized protein E1B28_007811 [Marasmius oreades]KAG7094204.1 hypothetical protein E1B28_007811 [Marasmius oreades]
MDLYVGPDDITPDKDYKHVHKWIRNTILRLSGISIEGLVITPDLFKRHFHMAEFSSVHISSLFNPKDKQDVKLAFNLLKDIWSLPSMTATESLEKPFQSQIREAIRVYGQLCCHLVFPYVCIELSLSEQLEHLSTAAHLAFALYSYQNAGKQFMPTTLYVDIMLMVRNAYFCVAKSKVDDPDGEFWFILLGMDRLEILFEVANILTQHPEWQKTPRRLNLPSLDRNDNVISERVDHLNPKSWQGDVHTQAVSLQTCWKQGRKIIEVSYPFAKEVLTNADCNPDITLLSPFGTLLVRTPLDSDDVEDNHNLKSTSEESPDVMEGSRMVEDEAANAT